MAKKNDLTKTVYVFGLPCGGKQRVSVEYRRSLWVVVMKDKGGEFERTFNTDREVREYIGMRRAAAKHVHRVS